MAKEWRGVLAFDDFDGRVVALKKPPWFEVDAPADDKWKPGRLTDTDTTRVRAWLARKHKMVLNETEAYAAINAAAEARVIHPVREYLQSLKWDGTARLDTWLITFCGAEDTPLIRAISAAWMISAIARVMRPGCKADHMLVLVGVQGAGKSTALEALVPDENWFHDEWDPNTKDGRLAMLGRWIIEVGELAALKRSEVEQIKAALSRRREPIRVPYGRRDGWYPRQCILAGTTNADEFLRDDSGNRRFWPVKVGDKIDVKGLRDVRDLLWAEARARFELGEAWHLKDRDLIEAAKQQQEVRLVADPREDIVSQWLARDVDQRDDEGHVFLTPRSELGATTKELLIGALTKTKDQANQGAQLEAAKLLRACGWATCGKKHTLATSRTRLFFPTATGCLACSGRWDSAAKDDAPEKKNGKEIGPIGQTGHHPGITGKTAPSLPRR